MQFVKENQQQMTESKELNFIKTFFYQFDYKRDIQYFNVYAINLR